MLHELTNIWQQSSETQSRMELQAMSEDSQWGEGSGQDWKLLTGVTDLRQT